MKKVLIVSYFFPPTGGVGVQRVLKFVKYLPHFGWQPTVLTVRNPDYKMLNPELLKDVPKPTKIIRTGTIEPSKIYNFFADLVERTKPLLTMKRLAGKTELDFTPKERLATKISDFIFLPDNRVGWLPFAFMAMLRKLRKENFDMIFSTSPPFTAHLVGLIAKFILNKPWVVDFRDLWVLDPSKKPSTKIHLLISKYIEHKVLKFGGKILTVSEPLSEDLKKTYPDIPSKKFEMIPNGYDAEDFKIKSNGKRSENFSFGHIGSLNMSDGRTPYYFLTALANLKKDLAELVKKMRVSFVGPVDRLNKKIIEEMVFKFDLKDIVRCVDFVSHSQAIGYMKNSNILLFIPGRSYKGWGSDRGNISGKLYEYFATGKPILALTEDGPIRDLIMKSGCDIQVDHSDIQQIRKEILNCYNKFREGRLNVEPNWDFIEKFERKKLTRQLATIFGELSV